MTYKVHYNGKFYKGLTHEMQSPSHSKKITYEVGNTYTADDFVISAEACAPGIHVVTSLALALKWGPVVIEVTIPDGAEVVWGEEKLRTSKIEVVSVISLTGADLTRADLYGADLTRANLTGADLYGADLTGADLYGADLTRADLYGADLTRANLTGADLTRAYLYGADLTRANLTGADLTGAYLYGATGLPYIGMPDGWELDDNGFWVKS